MRDISDFFIKPRTREHVFLLISQFNIEEEYSNRIELLIFGKILNELKFNLPKRYFKVLLEFSLNNNCENIIRK